MGLNITCDCCQKPVEKATEVGYVKTAFYCETCLPRYENYKLLVDEFHDGVASTVITGLEKIKRIWLENNPGAILPDSIEE